MTCGLRCASRGGEGAHFFRKHGIVAAVRHLYDCSQCPNCLREYHTCGQLQMHLRHSTGCREGLQARRIHLPPVAGIGSTEPRQAVRQHDGLLPPLQAQGPHLPARPPVRPDPDHMLSSSKASSTFWRGDHLQKRYCRSLSGPFEPRSYHGRSASSRFSPSSSTLVRS